MGYSSRYHTASLVAVFVALAVGIVIGAALGSDIVTGTAEDLERDLGEDLDRLRAENAELQEELAAERELAEQLFPVLVGRRLEGQNVGLFALGNVQEGLISAIRAAIEPSGGRLTEVAVIGEPVDPAPVIDAMLGTGRQVLQRQEAVELAAARAAKALAGRGPRFDHARDALLQRFSGTEERLDAVVVVRSQPDELEGRERTDTEAVERGVIEGLLDEGMQVVGAERTEDDPSQIEFFESHGLSTVDNVDQLVGKFALVLLLEGTDGSYGVKETADGLLPELIQPAEPIQPEQ
ncbi:MAG TPA: copper transporter [Solirubrobacterales bacterium]|jgi:hypothetical protein